MDGLRCTGDDGIPESSRKHRTINLNMKKNFFETERKFLRSRLESAASTGLLRSFGGVTGRRAPTGLTELKHKLLLSELVGNPHPDAVPHLCGAANTAAELAWETDFPTLLFPCLFEELTRVIHYRHALAELDESEDRLLQENNDEASLMTAQPQGA